MERIAEECIEEKAQSPVAQYMILYRSSTVNGQIDPPSFLRDGRTDLYPLSGRAAFVYCGEMIRSLLIAVVRECPSFIPHSIRRSLILRLVR
jgi:hypothetical protein